MKKFALSLILLTFIFHISCSSDKENCKTCNNIVGTGSDVDVCDNGDGTATLTISKNGRVTHSETTVISEGGSIDDFICDDFDFTFNL